MNTSFSFVNQKNPFSEATHRFEKAIGSIDQTNFRDLREVMTALPHLRFRPGYTLDCCRVGDTSNFYRKLYVYRQDSIFNVLDRERPEGIAAADSYSSATRKTILAALPGYFKTDDMKTVAKNVAKSLRTVRRQVARAIQAGEIQQVKHGEYKK